MTLPRTVLIALIVGVASLAVSVSTASAVKLKGSIQLTAGATSGPTPYAGSWVQLYETADPSVYFTNPSSPAADQNYTPLVNGTEGVDLGLPVQGLADPPFDSKGNSLTSTILSPEPFAGTNFSSFVTLNNAKKAKFGKKGLVVEVASGSSATEPVTTADLTGWTIAYGGGYYDTPGSTANVGDGGNLTGSITWTNRKKHSLGGTITLDWSVPIVNPPGNPFDAFTAQWQLVGTYVPS
ncbi:MAG: hypothetical protein ABSG95_14195 [Solirubrobacteraceae bacterium]